MILEHWNSSLEQSGTVVWNSLEHWSTGTLEHNKLRRAVVIDDLEEYPELICETWCQAGVYHVTRCNVI